MVLLTRGTPKWLWLELNKLTIGGIVPKSGGSLPNT